MSKDARKVPSVLLLVVPVCLITVVLAGGHLGALADVRFRALWALGGAFALQLLIITIVPGSANAARATAHIGSYALAVWFLLANRRLPYLWLIALGTALNFAAILANGGVMPASASALAAAGLEIDATRFSNSAVVDGARLAFLGDVFAIPASWPLATVFSVGDICIAVGVLLVLHQLTGSRLLPGTRRQRARAGHGSTRPSPPPPGLGG